MITASHNPHHDNGMKLFNNDGCKLDKDSIIYVAVIKELRKALSLSIEEICTLFSNFKDFGKGDTAVPQDQKSRIFNNLL